MGGYTQKQAMRDTFIQAVEHEHFKNDAFHGLINKDTSFEEALNIFLKSSALTQNEKDTYFEPMRTLMETIDKKEKKDFDYPGKLLDTLAMANLGEIFVMDAQSRYSGRNELYDAPLLVQRVEPGLKVSETYTIDNHGNRKDFKNGQYGVTPDAPDWFKRMQKDRMKPFRDNMKKEEEEEEAKSAGDNSNTSTSSHPATSDEEDNRVTVPVVQAPSTQKTASKKVCTKQGADGDFGAAFEKNAKRFFF